MKTAKHYALIAEAVNYEQRARGLRLDADFAEQRARLRRDQAAQEIAPDPEPPHDAQVRWERRVGGVVYAYEAWWDERWRTSGPRFGQHFPEGVTWEFLFPFIVAKNVGNTYTIVRRVPLI